MRQLGTGRWGARFFAAAIAGSAVLALTQCKKSPAAPTKVAASDLNAAASASTLAAIDGQTFTFPGGGAAFSPVLAGQTVALTFSNTSSATPTATFGVGSGQFTATTTFGSCIFTVTSSNVSGLTVGQVLTVNPCLINVGLSGKTIGVVQVPLSVIIGGTRSTPITVAVTVAPNGTVTLGNKTLGTVTITTGSGGA